MGEQGMGKPWGCLTPMGALEAGLKIAHEASVKVGARLIPGLSVLLSAETSASQPPHSRKLPCSSAILILYSPTVKTKSVFTLLASPACLKAPH